VPSIRERRDSQPRQALRLDHDSSPSCFLRRFDSRPRAPVYRAGQVYAAQHAAVHSFLDQPQRRSFVLQGQAAGEPAARPAGFGDPAQETRWEPSAGVATPTGFVPDAQSPSRALLAQRH
jgi:hypothetical protein